MTNINKQNFKNKYIADRKKNMSVMHTGPMSIQEKQGKMFNSQMS